MAPHRHQTAALGCKILAIFSLALTCCAGEPPAALSETTRVLPKGQLPNDHRLGPLKDLDGYFPFVPCDTPDEWANRAERVRRNIAVAVGLWPMPGKTPLNAVIHGKIDQPEYTIEKVYFESVPGFFVTGNLYRPKGATGKLPAVLSPHGHWKNGRFFETSVADLKKQLADGGERFENGGRSPLQSRCVQLARMGCVVFHYDMIGYADNVQIPETLAHGFAKQRPEMNAAESWGLFSPQAEARLQSVMGLQSWNSIRALDFLLSLPEVDSSRVAVTGASGGGTQTFILCALDARPAVSFPAVMVSTAMQGGCTCENACLLRVDTGNVEIAALFAPKPLGMTAANDWTKEMPEKGFPELQKHFAMLEAPQNVMLKPLLQFGHNYNYPSRAAMYSWLNEHLKLGKPDAVERDYQFLTASDLSVWDAGHPRPEGGPAFERQLLKWITERDQKLLSGHQASVADFREVYGGALDAMIGRDLTDAGNVSRSAFRQASRGAYSEKSFMIRNTSRQEEVPAVVLEPVNWRNRAVIWVDPAGKSGLFGKANDGRHVPRPGVQKLLDAGVMVIGADLLYQGEFLADSKPLARSPKVVNPREAAAYTFGYNSTLFSKRVHDLLTVIQYARNQIRGLERLDIAGLNGAGHWAAAARAQAGQAINCAAVDTGGFRFANVSDIYDVDFLPGGAKYGDLPGIIALGAPGKLWLAGEGGKAPELVRHMYSLSGATGSLALSKAPPDRRETAAVDWLLAQKR